jgi:uncharacterized lipoprotein YddW (UPF0748 family)
VDSVSPPDPAATPLAPETPEVRGVWVVRTTLTSPEAIREMVERTHAAGFNTLLVQVRGRGDAFYRSALEPRSVVLDGTDPGFDPLATVIREAHARGMTVHGWVVAQLVWGLGPLPEDPDHLVNRHPDWLSVPESLATALWAADPWDPEFRSALHEWALANRDRVEGLFVDPGHPEVREHLAGVVRDLLLGYDLDGVHLDYLRYPSPDFDYSRRSLERFRDWAGSQVPRGLAASLDDRVRQGDVTAWVRENPELWDAFRETRITGLLRAVRRTVEATAPDAVLSVAVFPDPVDAERGRFQDWRGWLANGEVDAVAPMAYTPDDGRFADLMRAATEADRDRGGSRVWAGVGIYQTSLDGAVRKVDLARASGVAGVVLFSYDWAREQGLLEDGEPYLEGLARRAFLPGATVPN